MAKKIKKVETAGAAKKALAKVGADCSGCGDKPCDRSVCKGKKVKVEVQKKPTKLPPLSKQKPFGVTVGENVRMVVYVGDSAEIRSLKVVEVKRGKVSVTDRGKLQHWIAVLKPIGFKFGGGKNIEVSTFCRCYGHNDWAAVYNAIMHFPFMSGEQRLVSHLYDIPLNDAKFDSLVILAAKHAEKHLAEIRKERKEKAERLAKEKAKQEAAAKKEAKKPAAPAKKGAARK